MRLYDLIGLSDEEASSLIAKSPKSEMKAILDNPEILSEKLLVFRGNYDGFDTNRLCARTFKYIPAENRWKVSDITIYDMFVSSFAYHFSREELEAKFKAFCNATGFIMDA